MNKIICFASVLLMACGSSPSHQLNGDAVSIEKEAVKHLHTILNSGEGHMMTAAELAHQDGYQYNSLFAVNLPITDADERPLYDTPYIDDATGSRIVFHQESIEGDTIRPIGTADFRTVIHDWEQQAPHQILPSTIAFMLEAMAFTPFIILSTKVVIARITTSIQMDSQNTQNASSG